MKAFSTLCGHCCLAVSGPLLPLLEKPPLARLPPAAPRGPTDSSQPTMLLRTEDREEQRKAGTSEGPNASAHQAENALEVPIGPEAL